MKKKQLKLLLENLTEDNARLKDEWEWEAKRNVSLRREVTERTKRLSELNAKLKENPFIEELESHQKLLKNANAKMEEQAAKIVELEKQLSDSMKSSHKEYNRYEAIGKKLNAVCKHCGQLPWNHDAGYMCKKTAWIDEAAGIEKSNYDKLRLSAIRNRIKAKPTKVKVFIADGSEWYEKGNEYNVCESALNPDHWVLSADYYNSSLPISRTRRIPKALCVIVDDTKTHYQQSWLSGFCNNCHLTLAKHGPNAECPEVEGKGKWIRVDGLMDSSGYNICGNCQQRYTHHILNDQGKHENCPIN